MTPSSPNILDLNLDLEPLAQFVRAACSDTIAPGVVGCLVLPALGALEFRYYPAWVGRSAATAEQVEVSSRIALSIRFTIDLLDGMKVRGRRWIPDDDDCARLDDLFADWLKRSGERRLSCDDLANAGAVIATALTSQPNLVALPLGKFFVERRVAQIRSNETGEVVERRESDALSFLPSGEIMRALNSHDPDYDPEVDELDIVVPPPRS